MKEVTTQRAIFVVDRERVASVSRVRPCSAVARCVTFLQLGEPHLIGLENKHLAAFTSSVLRK